MLSLMILSLVNIAPAVIAAGIGAAGAIAGGAMSAQGSVAATREANQANKELYAMQRADAATAVRTRAIDLEAAGLSKTLAAGDAATVATPPQMQAADGTLMGEGVSRASGHIKDAINARAQQQLVKAQTHGMELQNEQQSIINKYFEDKLRDEDSLRGQGLMNARFQGLNIQANTRRMLNDIERSLDPKREWDRLGYPGAENYPDDAKEAILANIVLERSMSNPDAPEFEFKPRLPNNATSGSRGFSPTNPAMKQTP